MKRAQTVMRGSAGALFLLILLAACSQKEARAPFTQIEWASVNVREFAVITRIQLQTLPPSLPYNAAELPENRLEYEWRVSFDVDGDGTAANNIDLVLAKFKFPGSGPAEGPVTDFAQHSVLRVDETGRGMSVISASRVRQEGDALILSVAKSQHPDLAAITRITPWQARTYHGVGEDSSLAYYPPNGAYFIPGSP